MKHIVSRVVMQTGLSKKTGNSYSMARISILSPHQDVDRENLQIHGSGYEQVELSCSEIAYPAIEEAFTKAFSKTRSPVVLDLEMILSRDGTNLVVGINTSQPLQAAS